MAAPIKLPLNGIISVYLQSTIVIKVPMKGEIELYNISFLIFKVELHFKLKLKLRHSFKMQQTFMKSLISLVNSEVCANYCINSVVIVFG